MSSLHVPEIEKNDAAIVQRKKNDAAIVQRLNRLPFHARLTGRVTIQEVTIVPSWMIAVYQPTLNFVCNVLSPYTVISSPFSC